MVWYEVPKCHSLGMQTSSRKRYDPKPQLIGENIPFIANKTLKFLGGQIRVLQSCKEHKQYLSDKLSQLLDKVNKTPVTRKTEIPFVQSGNLPSIELGSIHSGTAIFMSKFHPRSQGYSLSQEVVRFSQISRFITPLPPEEQRRTAASAYLPTVTIS